MSASDYIDPFNLYYQNGRFCFILFLKKLVISKTTYQTVVVRKRSVTCIIFLKYELRKINEINDMRRRDRVEECSTAKVEFGSRFGH